MTTHYLFVKSKESLRESSMKGYKQKLPMLKLVQIIVFLLKVEGHRIEEES